VIRKGPEIAEDEARDFQLLAALAPENKAATDGPFPDQPEDQRGSDSDFSLREYSAGPNADDTAPDEPASNERGDSTDAVCSRGRKLRGPPKQERARRRRRARADMQPIDERMQPLGSDSA
jgi:hypothetical protein